MDDIQDFRQVDGIEDKKSFAERVAEYTLLCEYIKEMEDTKKAISKLISEDLITAGAKSVLCDNRRVTVADGKNTTISKEKLLELGVPAKTILKATKVTPYTYIVIGKEKV